jgi:hypothetical protein
LPSLPLRLEHALDSQIPDLEEGVDDAQVKVLANAPIQPLQAFAGKFPAFKTVGTFPLAKVRAVALKGPALFVVVAAAAAGSERPPIPHPVLIPAAESAVDTAGGDEIGGHFVHEGSPGISTQDIRMGEIYDWRLYILSACETSSGRL